MNQRLKALVAAFLCAVVLFPSPRSFFAESPKSNAVSIAMATDNNYVYPALIAMISMLENKNPDTILNYYIMTSNDITSDNKNRFKKLQEYYAGCSVELINMKNRFSREFLPSGHITTPTYYRLCLPSLLPKLDKILYLDGDILVRKDPKNFYNTNLEENYIGGVKDFGKIICELGDDVTYAKRMGIKNMRRYVNAGVLLLNLKKMRKDGIENKFNNYLPTLKRRKLLLNDQDVLNAVCYDKIKFLSPEYNAMQHFGFSYETMPILTECYEASKWKNACANPTVVHYSSPNKPWNNPRCRFYSEWNKYREIAEKLFYSHSVKEGTYRILSKVGKNKSVDISQGSLANGANVQLWDASDTNAQKFKITHSYEGFYEIQALCSGKMIDVSGASKKSGTNVQQYDKNGTDAQKWLLKQAKDGCFYIISKCGGLCLDVSGGSSKNGTNIQIWNFNGSNAQKFKLLNIE